MRMSKEIKNKVVPKLRFPEFKDADGWKEKQLGDISEIVRGGSPRPIEEFLTKSKDGLNWLKIGDVSFESKYITQTQEKVILEALTKTRQVSPGDLILSNSMSFGRPYILKINSCIHDGWIAIREIHNSVITDFLYYSISSENSQAYFNINAAGAAVRNLNAEIIKLLPIVFPGISEQQKIADCLSSLDDLIMVHNQKLEALKTHKKGLMQQLFPANGQMEPKLRFPKFRKSGKWEECLLGQLIEIKGRIGYRGYTIGDIVNKGEGAISLSPSNFDGNGSLIFEKSTYISWLKYEESPEIMLKKGFTVLVKTGSSYGKTALVEILPEKATINPQIVVLKPKKINPTFLFLIVSNNAIQKQIHETVVGGAIPTLSQESISKFEILMPKKEEQQKIADCLFSLDKLINAHAEKIEALKTDKRGLMQGLFPNLNDISQ
jgi:type I restriction enzyme S subunit